MKGEQLELSPKSRPEAQIRILASAIGALPPNRMFRGPVPRPWGKLDRTIIAWMRIATPDLVRSVRIKYEVSLFDGPEEWVFETTCWIPPTGQVDTLDQFVRYVSGAGFAAELVLARSRSSAEDPDPEALSIYKTALAFRRLLG